MPKKNKKVSIGDLKKLLETAPDDTDISSLLPEKEVIEYVVPEMASQMPIDGKIAHIKHSCNPGDIIASLVACKRYSEITGRKVKYLQTVGQPAAYYPGATHPTLDETGTAVTLNKPMFEMIKPLVESQRYIDSFEVYQGQRVDVDFDVIRGKTFVNLPHGSIQSWIFYAFPDLESDISQPWMFLDSPRQQIEEVTKTKIILNFTERYRNSKIMLDYYFLKEYSPDLIFAGTEVEHFKFCHRWNLNIPRLEVRDFLELAYAIRGCRFLLSNQSMCWNIATALGTPRLLEVCDFAQNCLPFYGKNNLGFFHQLALGHYFRLLYNQTINK